MSDRRRRRIVDRFQHKLILRLISYWLLYQFTLWNVLFCWQLLRQGRGDLIAQYTQYCYDFWPALLCFAILAPAFAWDAAKFYHRVAGPIVHIRRTVRSVAARMPVNRVKLRENDELKELQDEFNEMLETLAGLGAVTLLDGQNSSRANGDNGETVAVVPYDSSTEDGAHVAS